MATQFSDTIRNNFGLLNPCEDGDRHPHELEFRQRGQQVFKEVCPMVTTHITDHLAALSLAPADVRRFWLHQANPKMDQLIAKGVLDRVPDKNEAPAVLTEFANTSSAGSVIAFHRQRNDLAAGDIGVICLLGAGYSIGSLVVRKVS